MNHLTKKRILISTEQQNAQVGAFFRELGLELCSVFDKEHLADYLFIVDDYLEELKILPRIQTKKMIAPTCLSEVRGFFDENLINEKLSRTLLSSYFSDAQDFDLVDRFSKDFQDVFTLKIHDYLNVGYFIDTIVVEAYKNKFDFDKIRNYLNIVFNYSLKLIEQNDGHPPIEVSFSYSNTGFAVQVSMDAPDLNVSKEFNSNGEKLINFSSNTNYFEVSYLKKRERLYLSSLWFKEKNLQSFKSYFLTEIGERKSLKETNSTLINRLDEGTEIVSYEAVSNKADQSKKLHLARKFCLFIKNFRTSEESPVELASLTIDDIDTYLANYPRPDAILAVDLEIKNFIIKLLNDDSLFDGVTDYIQKIANSNLDSHVDEIQRILGQKSLEDISEIIKISAGPKDDSNDVMRVSGWTEAKNEEEWKVKRTGLIEQIKEQVIKIQSSGRNVVESDIIKIVSLELGVDPEVVKSVVKGLVDEAVSSELVKKEKLEDAFALRFLSQQPGQDAAREKLEGQILRMKKIMDQMRSEIVKLLVEAEASKKERSSPFGDEQTSELLDLKQALTKTLEMMKTKEKIAQKQKTDFEQILSAKENKIQTQETYLEQLKGEFSRSREFANEEKLELLQVENNSLTSRLELANRKINIINENMNKLDNDSTAKKEKELVTLKTNMQMAQALIEKFKHERSDLESKLLEEKEKNIKLRDEKGVTGGPSKEQVEKDLLMTNLQAEKKSLEEKYRAQVLELKKMEQKLKFTTAQLEESQKRKAQPAVASTKSNETYIKQLENANARITEANNEVTEKKKEAIKLKQENTLLASKVSELEKKLGNSEKKAA
ncbi:MAG: hypothetical protein H7281_08995 [Bacteriovorax sp.]|nr:hypothetical protein [Bacteriovorax sp.]